MDKEVAKQIRKSRRKERQDKQARIKTLIALTIVENRIKIKLQNNKPISLLLGHL